jgi:hypothetical protein
MDERLLSTLPDDLARRGWQWVPFESRTIRSGTKVWCKAVYARRFAWGMDDERRLVHRHDAVWVVVSTNLIQSATWEDAHRDAIALMREADARRTPSA